MCSWHLLDIAIEIENKVFCMMLLKVMLNRQCVYNGLLRAIILTEKIKAEG